jgi:superfamily I DNA/RNA helicase
MTLIRRRVAADAWQPIGVEALEPNAFDVVRSTNNRSVIAGPGSGKTELLAQRASYLLQCGIARLPRRILAISFKRDAATNLATRVRSRCHPDQAYRFDSLTFDAFAKGLVDRFGPALPDRWRPSSDYEIAYPTDRDYRDFLQALTPPANIGTKADIIAITVKQFERKWLLGTSLPEADQGAKSPGEWAAAQYWKSSLRPGRKTFLSFPMIGRLAELLVHSNPMVRDALRLTYSHLFMDEFQDTTQVQYDLMKAIFLGSATVVTAVGDNKQQIMRWAMAMDNPFGVYETDFNAQRTPLLNNYRSSPALVQIQDVLAKALDAKSNTLVSKTPGAIRGDSCAVWDFSTPAAEATKLADFVAAQMKQYKLSPRDFAILVRQKPGDYMKELAPAFTASGLTLRNEAASIGPIAIQDLLAEDLSCSIVTLLRLLATHRAGRHWTACLDMMCILSGFTVDDDAGRARMVRELTTFADGFKKRYPSPTTDKNTARKLLNELVEFISKKSILAAWPAYRRADWFDKVLTAATHHLDASSQGAPDWQHALDAYEGIHAVPLMTIHKSKGLEYHTVIFVGLDDGAWWSFTNDSIEATAGFFVAFTRAKQRVVFSYCAPRGARTKIAPLYELLTKAGVKTVNMG